MGGKTVGRGLPLRLVSATQPRSGAARAPGRAAISRVGRMRTPGRLSRNDAVVAPPSRRLRSFERSECALFRTGKTFTER